jgi:cytochrome c oxidase subunit IV
MAHGVGALEHGAGGHAHEHEHPGERTYIRVAIFLAVITVIEVVLYYIEDRMAHLLLVGLLLTLSAIKFTAVVGWFMHLKFDDRRLLWIFLGGLIVGGSILIALDVLSHIKPIDYAGALIQEQPAADH